MEVERRAGLTPAKFFEAYMRPRRPVIITDGTARWNALAAWTPAYFRERWADKVVENQGSTWVIGELIDAIEASSADEPVTYLKNLHIQNDFPELLADLEGGLAFAEPNWFRSPLMPARFRQDDPVLELFIGGRGTQIAYLHYDENMIHNFISQVYGEKEFWFYAPDQTPFLYPEPDYPYFSQVLDPRDPDLAAFPRFEQARAHTAVLKPGETMFVPAGWWHKTYMDEPSISVGSHCVNASNWTLYRRDLCRSLGRAGNPKWRAMETYLAIAGVALRAGLLAR